MSPSSHIRPRRTATKGTTYQVRYRPGGRDTAHVVVATFRTRRDAQECKRWVDGELAAGRRPDYLARLAEAARRPLTVREIVDQYGTTQTEDAQAKRQRNMARRLGKLGEMEAEKVTGRNIQAWIDAQTTGDDALAPSSAAQYLGQLRRAFAWQEINPNPAAWTHLRLPGDRRASQNRSDPPERAEVEAMLSCLTPRNHAPVVLMMEATGGRISECLAATWGDVDWIHHRVRMRGTKTRAAQRWAPLWGEFRAHLERTPPEDRIATQSLFPRSSAQGVRRAMARACTASGIRHLTPHDLRDRWISCAHVAGVPLPLIREIVGHEDNTTTQDIYLGVILHEPAERLSALRDAVARMYGLAGGVMVGSQSPTVHSDIANSRENPRDGGYRDRSLAASPGGPSPSVFPAGQGESDGNDIPA